MGRPKVSFDEKYIPEPNSGCWLWSSAMGTDGYGQATGNKKAHRLSWELHVGQIPPGMQVCHKCDTPLCVNPKHLFLGTQKHNSEDMVRKGRSARGERAHLGKLVSNDVVAILSSSETHAALASRFGVAESAIWAIKAGRTWRHISRQGIVIPDPDPDYKLKRTK